MTYDGEDARIYANPHALPRTWVVAGQRRVTGGDAALAAITDPGFDARRTAVVERPVPGLSDGASEPAGTSRIAAYDGERVELSARADRRALVVLSDVWFPGWRATVDGRDAPIERVDYLLRGVAVGPGEHRIVLEYRPWSWRAGWIVSLLTAALLVCRHAVEECAPMAGSLERTLNRLRAAADPAALTGVVQRAFKHADRSRGIYPALGELAERYRGTWEPPDLTAFELRVFSQNGEDGVLAEILRRIGVAGGEFVEFGVQDGSEGNTVFLAQVLGWRGAYLEADDAAYAALERRYAANPRVRTLHAAVEPDTVEALFDRAGVPEEPDVVSIDVDGNDYWIWRALSRYRPRIVVIEYNGALDPGSRRVMPYTPGFRWDHTSGYGASLGALEELGGREGIPARAHRVGGRQRVLRARGPRRRAAGGRGGAAPRRQPCAHGAGPPGAARRSGLVSREHRPASTTAISDSPGSSQSQSSPACSAHAASAATGPASAGPARRAAAATAPNSSASRAKPTSPSSASVSRYSEWASRTGSRNGRSRSHSAWKPPLPTPRTGWSPNVRTATRQ